MSTTKERFLSSLVLALGIASLFPAANALGAAVVQESVGDVRAGATPAQSKPVAPNQRVLSGTLVTTAPGSRVVLRFDDGQLVALHENTQFRIEDFRFRPQESKADRKSTRLNSSHMSISYAVFCLKKKKKIKYSYILIKIKKRKKKSKK